MTQGQRAKYGNRRTVVDGIPFASKLEAARYAELRLLERAGEIRDLRLQPRYDLEVNGEHVTRFIGDFAYLTKEGLPVTEDAKGYETPEWKIKARLFKALCGRDVVVVKRAGR